MDGDGYWQWLQLRSRGNTIEAGHLGDPPEHRRRARARAAEGALSRMHFAFTPEQEALRAEARRWLDERYPPERVAELADSEAGWDPASWAELAELGWLGVSVAEDEGGAGLGFLEEAVLFEELGRALYPGPYFSTVALALPRLDTDDRAAVAAGEARWSAQVDGLVAGPRARRARGHRRRAGRGRGRDASETMDATRRLGRLASTGGRRGRRPAAATGGARARGGRGRAARPGLGRRARQGASAVRQVDRRLPGGVALARRRVHGDRARRARSPTGRRGASPRATSRRRRRPPRRRRTRPKRRCPRASARSRCTVESASPGSIRSTATTSGRSGSRHSTASPRVSGRRSRLSSSPESRRSVLITGASSGIGAACAPSARRARLAGAGGRPATGRRAARDDRGDPGRHRPDAVAALREAEQVPGTVPGVRRARQQRGNRRSPRRSKICRPTSSAASSRSTSSANSPSPRRCSRRCGRQRGAS